MNFSGRLWRVAVNAGWMGLSVGVAYGQAIDLATSKQISAPVPGDPQRLNGLPISMAVSPDRRWVVTVNAGYGTWESGYKQSLAVIDTQTGKVTDSPDDRTLVNAGQTLYSGLAFSADARHLYGNHRQPDGPRRKDRGGHRKWHRGLRIRGRTAHTRARHQKSRCSHWQGGRRTQLIDGVSGSLGVPFPSGVAVVHKPVRGAGDTADPLLVADNLSDDVLLIEPSSGKILTRFDLSESDAVPGTYPLAVAVSKDSTRGFVTLWNASEVVELDLVKGVVGRKLPLLKPSVATVAGHASVRTRVFAGWDDRCMSPWPTGMRWQRSMSHRTRNGRAAFSVKGYFDTRLPGQSYFGAEPEALAISADGRRLYVGNGAQDAVAVMDTTRLTAKAAKSGFVEPIGFVPTEWMPMSMGDDGRQAICGHGEGQGHRTQQLRSAADRRHQGKATLSELVNVYRHAALRIGRCTGYGRDGARSAAADSTGARR